MSQSTSPWASWRLPAGQWRRELLSVAYAMMETCWITPLFLVLVAPARHLAPASTLAVLGGLLLAFFALARLSERWTFEPGRARALLLLALPLAILASWRVFLHPAAPLSDLSWIRIAGSDLVAGRSSGHWAVMMAVLFLWWRGLALSRREFAFRSVAFAFRGGLLLLILGTTLLSLLVGRQVYGIIFLFFFASLLVVALTRLEEAGVAKGDAARSFDLFWTGLLIGAIALLLAVGLLLLLAASPAGMAAIGSLWAPIGNALLTAAMWIMAVLLAPFEPLLQWLVGVLADIWRSILDQPMVAALASLPLGAEQTGDSPAAIYLAAAWNATRLVCGAALVLVLVVVGLWLLNKQRSRQEQRADEHEALEGGLLDSLAALLRGGRDRLRRAAEIIGRFGIGSGLLAAVSVRNIYANTVRLAQQRGYPRHKARTPYEYLPDLLAAFPAAQAEARAITDAYVAVHYGELPASRAELAELRAAYERLRASA